MPTLEQVLDAIAEKLITYDLVDQSIVLANQKTIRNGIITLGRTNADKLILFEKDIKANKEDLELTSSDGASSGLTLNDIIQHLSDSWYIDVTGALESITIDIVDNAPADGGGVWPITDLLIDASNPNNPLNVSQFINIKQVETVVDLGQAEEYLDTTIFELLPGVQTRQERIDNFFIEWTELKGILPDFDMDGTDGGTYVHETFDPQVHSDLNDISPDNPDGNIVRLIDDTNEDNPTSNTLQSLRAQLDTYLLDIDEELDGLEDQRPTYQNKSDGYLKFRNLNQGIIIRNTDSQYVEGLNPETQEYLTTGFTITMWVRFLDKVSQGTLFNFGNPTRESNPLGFKLETLVSDSEKRYVRLLVWDGSRYYDSHTGISSIDKVSTTDLSSLNTIDITQYTEIPTDFSEWYFICANYDYNIDEGASTLTVQDPDFWLNHIGGTDGTGGYTSNSGYGNRAKVEFISRSDLLRARGYQS
jgi:hypothetical protein